MRRKTEILEEMLNFIISLEHERVDEVSMLRSFEDDISKMSQEGVETCLHIPDHLHLPR